MVKILVPATESSVFAKYFLMYSATVAAIADFPTPVPASRIKYFFPDSNASIIASIDFS